MGLTAEEAFSWFFREEYPNVLRTAGFILQDRRAAEDVAQEAFVQLYRHWRKVSKYDRPDAWVRRVAIRAAVKALRKKRFESMLSDQERPVLDSHTDPDLMRAIAALPTNQRAAIVLFYFEDRPIAEIAPTMDCSEATVKVHLHRARRKLADVLGDEVVTDVS